MSARNDGAFGGLSNLSAKKALKVTRSPVLNAARKAANCFPAGVSGSVTAVCAQARGPGTPHKHTRNIESESDRKRVGAKRPVFIMICLSINVVDTEKHILCGVLLSCIGLSFLV